MTKIKLVTEINADLKSCFDLARDVDAHKLSAIKTHEKAISGRTTGLCELGDRITWEAVHFGIRQTLSVEIVAMQKPYAFEDKMTKGAFKSMHHKHVFHSKKERTIMTDYFNYEVPYGLAGQLFDWLVLKRYMTNFLKTRNIILKGIAERKSNRTLTISPL